MSCQHLVRDWKNQVIMQDFSPREKEFERNIDGGERNRRRRLLCAPMFHNLMRMSTVLSRGRVYVIHTHTYPTTMMSTGAVDKYVMKLFISFGPPPFAACATTLAPRFTALLPEPTVTALRTPLTPTPAFLATRACVRTEALVLARCARTRLIIFIPAILLYVYPRRERDFLRASERYGEREREIWSNIALDVALSKCVCERREKGEK